MSDLIYHLEKENGNTKNPLVICIRSVSKKKLTKESLLALASSSSERIALERLLKGTSLPSIERVHVPADRSFEILKMLGTTGRVFAEGKKVVIDPFISYDIEGSSWRLGSKTGPLLECDWVFLADPCWILKDGIIRQVIDTVSYREMQEALKPPSLPSSEDADRDPLPQLVLTDRHGGFADLWFDYGSSRRIAAHDPTSSSYRKKEVERGWERDLLETDFIKKIVGDSHYYCPLDKVAKSLTFLLEIGWTIFDSAGRKVLRQRGGAIEATISDETLCIQAKVRYDDHEADLKDLMGAFNRREHFVSLTPDAVALIDRQKFAEQWGDLTECEITAAGIALPRNRFGLLQSFLDQDTFALKEEIREKITRLISCSPSQLAQVGKDFRGTLFSYQEEGLKWLKFLSDGGFSGLLADDMGLGKTVQVLAFFSQIVATKPLLVVAPTSLLFNWQREVEKFLPALIVYRHEGKGRCLSKEELEKKSLILTSYALLRIDADILQEIDYHMVVLDEAQAIKNGESQISLICSRLRCALRLAITGTPIENRFDDLWSIFRFLQPDLLGEKQAFQAQTQAGGLNPHYFSQIRKKIRPFILRRKKDQVALDLPPKLEQIVFVEMGEWERGVYESWLQKTKQGLLKKVTLEGVASHRMEILEAILRLRQLCAHPWLVGECGELPVEECGAKLGRLLSDLEDVVQEQQKVLVYSQFTTMLHLIEGSVKERGWKYVYLDGSSKEREKSVQQFQEDPQTQIFLISLKAGGVGLNLTAADYVFLYDPWWNAAVENQAIDRAHRLGKKGTVIARRYVTALSIEEKIMRLKEHKTALSEHLLESDEGGAKDISLDDLLQLLT